MRSVVARLGVGHLRGTSSYTVEKALPPKSRPKPDVAVRENEPAMPARQRPPPVSLEEYDEDPEAPFRSENGYAALADISSHINSKDFWQHGLVNQPERPQRPKSGPATAYPAAASDRWAQPVAPARVQSASSKG